MRLLSRLLLAISIATPALSQGLNVDLGARSRPVPGETYGGAAAQAGTWNAFGAPWSSGLFALDGSPTLVTLDSPGPGSGGSGEYHFDNSGTHADDGALIDDLLDMGAAGEQTSLTFDGLADGAYEVFTYAMAPDGANFRTTIEVEGSPDGLQIVGGAWPGSMQAGVTHARHSISVLDGSSVVVRIRALVGFGSVNGIQLVPEGALGQGFCSSSVNSSGGLARITASGSALVSSQDVTLTTLHLVPSVFGIYFFGSTQVQLPFGDGLRCAGGSVTRVQPAVPVTPSGIATRRLNFNAPYAERIVPGASLSFQFWYRDPLAGMAGFNLSDGRWIDFR